MISPCRERFLVFLAALVAAAVCFSSILRADSKRKVEPDSWISEKLFLESSSDSGSKIQARSLGSSVRQVELNPAVGLAGRWREGDSLDVELFDGSVRVARMLQVERDLNGSTTLAAKIEGSDFGYLVLSTNGKSSYGTIAIPEEDKKYEIRPGPQEAHFLSKEDSKEVSEWGCGAIIPDVESEGERRRVFSLPEESGSPSEPVAIDLMVAYTPAARIWADANTGGIA